MRKWLFIAVVLVVFALLVVFVGRHDRFELRREQFAEIETLLARIRQNFIFHHLGQGRFPRNNAEADLPAADTLTMGNLDGAVVMADERLLLRLRVSEDHVATVFLTPEMNSAEQFLWHCRSPDLPESLRNELFGGCRPTREHLTLESAIALQYKPKPQKAPAVVAKPVRSAEPVTQAMAMQTCELAASPYQVLLHDDGLGVWDLSGEPKAMGFLAHDVQRADAFHAQVGSTLFAVMENAIVFADTGNAAMQWEKSAVWVKPGTRLYSVGNRLLWITPEQNLFIGDVCQLPTIRIIHTMTLELGRREKILRMETVDDLVYMLSRQESDWGNSSELNIYRMKDNGTLLHRFHFQLDGLANGMHLAEPHLLVANGREGVFFYERTLDQRWMLAQKLSAMDFAMDVLLLNGDLWVADGAAGVLRFQRDKASGQWQRVAQQVFPFPAFHLQALPKGLLVSSATRHAWYEPERQQIKVLAPVTGGN